MDDKRKIPRKQISFYMRVLDDNTEQIVGHLVEVSEHGMRLEIMHPVPIGQVFNVHMELTPEISDKLFMFVSIRAKWCKPDDITPNLYSVGFEIAKISPHDHVIYKRMLELYGE